MALTLTCRRCDVTMTAETEEELTELGRQHAREAHGHSWLPIEKVLGRIRHQNREKH